MRVMFALVILFYLCLGYSSGKLQIDIPVEAEQAHFRFLYDFVGRVHEESPVDSVLVLQHRHNRDCLLHKWSSPDWPVLRINELTRINVNRMTVALVCLAQDDDIILFNALANCLNGMRNSRIIVWLHSKDIEYSQRKIARHAERYQFQNLIIMHVSQSLVIYKMHPYPQPSFKELTHWKSDPIFNRHWHNFHGKEATILPSLVPPMSYISINPVTGEKFLNGFMQNLLNTFAMTHNISLKLLRPPNATDPIRTKEALQILANGTLDFLVNVYPRTQSLQWIGIEESAYLSITSLYVVAPCSQQQNFQDVFDHIFPGFWLSSVLFLYIIFGILKCLSEVMTNYILGYGLRLRYSDVLNGNILRGFLGQAMPERPKSSFSLRHIMMLTCFYGFFFCSWINANLSTLMTKHLPLRHIETYDELKQSKLPVIFDCVTQQIVKWEYGETFFERNIPNAQFMSSKELTDLIFDFNTSYAYQSYTHIWYAIALYQKYTKYENFCRVNNILIASDLPLAAILRKNSMYGVPLNLFIRNVQSAGIDVYWKRKVIADTLMSKVAQRGRRSPIKPLDLINVKWILDLFICGIIISSLVLIAELGYYHWKRMRRIEG